MLDVGELDRRIVIQSTTESVELDGSITDSWATYATRWASIRYAKKASEDYEAGRKTSMYTVIFIVRSDSTTRAITKKMRISYDSKIYDIRAINEQATEYRKMYLSIEAEQKGPDNLG